MIPNGKFRGKCNITGEWIYGGYVYDREWDKHNIYTIKHVGAFLELIRSECVPDSIGQYIGLNDGKGINIYYKDIFKMPSGHIVVIDWVNGGFGYYSHGDFIGFSNHNHLKEILKGHIIGNTTDNPELLAEAV
jgi:hypothetical protein